MKYYFCYGVVKFHTFNNIPLKKKVHVLFDGLSKFFSPRQKPRPRRGLRLSARCPRGCAAAESARCRAVQT